MAKFANCNVADNTGTVGFHARWMYRLKELLKSAGWTVPSSGTGAAYSSNSDLITSALVLGTQYAWFIVRDPGGRREFSVQNTGASGDGLRMKYSALARFTGGAPGATRTPSATDEQVIFGGGTDASPTGGTAFSGGACNIHMVAYSTPVGNAYPFVSYATTSPGGGLGIGHFYLEAMAPGSYDPADADPTVMSIGSGGGIQVSSNLKGWFAYGTANQAWSTAISGANATFNGNLGTDLVNGYDVNGRPLYTGLVSTTRIKGWGATIALKGCARAYPGTCNRTTDSYVYLGSLAVPFADNTEPAM